MKTENSSEPRTRKALSKKSFLPYWDGDVYTKYAARSYDLITTLTGWRKKLARHALDGLKPCKALDVGCGTGYLMDLAAQKKFSITGLDPSEGMLAKAREKYGFPSNDLVLSGAEKMPFKDEEFDLVIASGSLVHVPCIVEAAKEIKRVLRPGGLLRIIDHADPIESSILTPLVYFFSHASGDILHDYERYFSEGCTLLNRKTLGRGGYMQRFDFIREP